jgi:hypothetical protein
MFGNAHTRKEQCAACGLHTYSFIRVRVNSVTGVDLSLLPFGPTTGPSLYVACKTCPAYAHYECSLCGEKMHDAYIDNEFCGCVCPSCEERSKQVIHRQVARYQKYQISPVLSVPHH